MKVGDVMFCKTGCAGAEGSWEEGENYPVTQKNLELMRRLLNSGHFVLMEKEIPEAPKSTKGK